MQSAFHKNAQYALCLCEKGSTPFTHKCSTSDVTSPLDRVSLKRANLGGERERGANDGTQYKRNYIISDTRSNESSDT
jgi:hypothetical protein